MHNAFIVTGTLTDAHTVALDEALPLLSTKVRLVVEPLTPAAAHQPSYQEVLAMIRERQRLRGYRPPTREEVDASVEAERESWGDG